MINIRNEEPRDYRITEEITRRAFWNLYLPGADEHYLLHKMREHEDFIPELAFVIEEDGVIVGSIYYTHAKIITESGEAIPVISFGPVSIEPSLHRRGLGRKLITHSKEKARDLGYRAIVIAGFPYHYEPYGFVGSKKYGISMPDGKYYTAIQALPLYEGALEGIMGKIEFSPGMYPDKKDQEEYEKTFPPMEKLELPRHKDFELMSQEIDEREFS